MSSNTSPLLPVLHTETTNSKWARRRDIPLAILAWVAVVGVFFWGASHIVRTILLLALAALLAYAMVPAVKLLRRYMPRFLAILVVYLLVLVAVSLLFYLVASSAIEQVRSLVGFVRVQLTPAHN